MDDLTPNVEKIFNKGNKVQVVGMGDHGRNRMIGTITGNTTQNIIGFMWEVDFGNGDYGLFKSKNLRKVICNTTK